MRTLLPLLTLILLSLALHADAQQDKSNSRPASETSTHRALTAPPMRRRPQFRRGPTPTTRKTSIATPRAIVARRGPSPPALTNPAAAADSAGAPGIVPPKGIAKQLNQAKFHEFMSLARSLMKSRRALA